MFIILNRDRYYSRERTYSRNNIVIIENHKKIVTIDKTVEKEHTHVTITMTENLKQIIIKDKIVETEKIGQKHQSNIGIQIDKKK